jgi:hypothetical protein
VRSGLKIAARAALAVGMGVVWGHGVAEEPDTMFCSVSQAIVCPEQSECTRTVPESVNLPRLLKIDLARREVVSLRVGGERRGSKILHLAKDDGVYVLQGAEKGKGWTATVHESDGRLTVTASSPGDGYVIFGMCATTF